MSIHIIGTSHISPRSAERVREAVRSGEYDIVAVELDQARLHQLLSGAQPETSLRATVKAVGLSGALFAKLGHWVEVKMGGRIGTAPGDEMKAAVLAAAEKDIPVALIDRPIEVTLRRFSKAFNWREKLRLFKGLFRFTRVKFDLRDVPDEKLVTEMLTELDRISPAIARVLVHERNDHMARQLLGLQQSRHEARILAVVGAGHVPGMTERLNTLQAKAGHADGTDAPHHADA